MTEKIFRKIFDAQQQENPEINKVLFNRLSCALVGGFMCLCVCKRESLAFSSLAAQHWHIWGTQ